MDSAPSDSTPKLDTSSTNAASVPSSGNGTPGISNSSYYQPAGGQVASEPAAVSPAQPTGVVPPAPGSPTLGSMPSTPPVVAFESPTRSNLPTMGMNATPVSGSTVPPTVSAQATANQVQERMQAANSSANGKSAGKKRSLLLPILGVILVLAIAAAAAFWWWSNRETDLNLVGPNDSLTQEEQLPENDPQPLVTEGVQERDESLAVVTATEQFPEDLSNTAKVYGLVCKYEDSYPQGTVLFYQPESNAIYRVGVPADQNVYTLSVPAGQYMAFFDPAAANLPIFALTEYVNCGMDPNSCTDHTMALFTVEAGQEYGQVDLCDLQYNQDDLPAELQYENS